MQRLLLLCSVFRIDYWWLGVRAFVATEFTELWVWMAFREYRLMAA